VKTLSKIFSSLLAKEWVLKESQREAKPLLNLTPSLSLSQGIGAGESKRGEASLIYPFPLPLNKGKGDKGG